MTAEDGGGRDDRTRDDGVRDHGVRHDGTPELIDRRRFVRILGGAAGLVGLFGVGLVGVEGTRAGLSGPSHLSPRLRRAFLALAETHFPATEDGPSDGAASVDGRPGGAASDLLDAFERYLAGAHPDDVRDLRRGLLLLEFGPLLFAGRLRTFSGSSPTQRLDHWRDWMESPVLLRRQVATAFRRFLATVYFDRPEVWPRIGYPGPQAVAARKMEPGATLDLSQGPVPASVTAEAVVIGSGAAGATAAWVLAEAGLDVLVLEEGGDRTGPELTQRDAEMYDQLYMGRGGRLTDDLSVTILQGRALGGGTVINTSDVVSIPDAVYHHWVQRFGLRDFTPGRMRSYAERTRRDLSTNAIPEARLSPGNRILLEGGRRAGLETEIMEHNRVGCAGLGKCMLGCPLGAKRNARSVAIPAALALGARVFTRARAVAVRRAVSDVKEIDVRVLDPLGHHEIDRTVVRARIVVIAANAIGSAALLLRSGIGNEHVGRHLSLQPQLPIVAVFDEDVRAFVGIPQAVALTSGEIQDHPEHGLWGYRVEAIMGTPGMAASLLPWAGTPAQEMMGRYPRMAAALALTPDRPTGRVHIDSGGRIRIDYELAPDVLERMKRGVADAAGAYLAAGAREVWVPSTPPLRIASLRDLGGLAGLELAPCRAPIMSAHQQGGVRMSVDPRSGPASPDGRVRGTRGVYVVDSALYPSSASSHTMAPIMTTARMLSEQIAAAA